MSSYTIKIDTSNMNFKTRLSTIHLHKKMVINQIVRFHGPKDNERHMRKQLQLFIQKRQLCQNRLKNSTNVLIDAEIEKGGYWLFYLTIPTFL